MMSPTQTRTNDSGQACPLLSYGRKYTKSSLYCRASGLGTIRSSKWRQTHLVDEIAHSKVDSTEEKDKRSDDRVGQTNEEDEESLGINRSQANDGRCI